MENLSKSIRRILFVDVNQSYYYAILNKLNKETKLWENIAMSSLFWFVSTGPKLAIAIT